MKRRIPAALLLFMAVSSAGSSAEPGDGFDGLRARIVERIEEHGVPSLAVGVARGGRILWEEGFGWADRARRVPATEHTPYSLASVTKPVTATGLMILVQRGLVDLDAPVNRYLGGASLRARVGSAEEATVRRVANHTAGLPLHYQFFYEDEPARPPPMAETIRRYGNLVTAPGERYRYSNLGYGVIDHLIAEVSGRDYLTFMQLEVFGPLGMDHTAVGIPPGQESLHALRYDAGGEPIPFYDFDHRGGSAVYSCVHDLLRFGLFHLNGALPGQEPVLPKSAIEAMQRPTADTAENDGYATGWAIGRDEEGYRTVSHGGGMGGVSTRLTLVPSEKLVVAVLSNSHNSLSQAISDEILAHLLPRSSRRRQADGSRVSGVARGARFKPVKGLVGTWTGTVETWERELPFSLTVDKSGAVHARLGSQPRVRLGGVRFRNGFLHAAMTGTIGTTDADRRPHRLQLELKLRGRELNGSLIAISLPGRRVGNALAHWIALSRKEELEE